MDTINEPKKVKARKEHQCDYSDKTIRQIILNGKWYTKD